MSHLYPLVELAKHLVHHHGFSATILTFSNFSSPAQSNLLSSLHPEISSLSLPLIPLDDIPTNGGVETFLATLASRSVPNVHKALNNLKKTATLVAFVADLFGSDFLPVAKELCISHYLFYPSTCTSLMFFLHFPFLDKTTTCKYEDLPGPLLLPGCPPLYSEDFPDTFKDRNSEAYSLVLNVMSGYTNAQGIIVNTFKEMEPEASEALKNEEKYPPICFVGPFLRQGINEDASGNCLNWLDQQPSRSVLFISFGSGGALSQKQISEMAFGLEASGQRFMWVVRCPSDKDTSDDYFSQEKSDDPLNYLPEGFIERNMTRGMVVPLWAPQVKVLSHKATGGFLSHCGWNSTLESICHGVPIIAWPLFAEQRINARVLVEGAGIALRPKVREDGAVERGEIARVVRELMQEEAGKAVRQRVEGLRDAGIRALASMGSSHLGLTKVADQWKEARKSCV